MHEFRTVIRPQGDIVLIRRLPPQEVSDAGLFLVYDPDFKEDIGEVVAVGPGKAFGCKQCRTEHVRPVEVQPGDRVLFSTNGHQIQNVQGVEYVILRAPSIIGVFHDE